MISQIRKKIINSKVKTNPFPYIFIRNIFDNSYVDELNNFLPSYKNLNGKEIMFQSKSKSKKTILPSSRAYKQLSKKKMRSIIAICYITFAIFQIFTLTLLIGKDQVLHQFNIRFFLIGILTFLIVEKLVFSKMNIEKYEKSFSIFLFISGSSLFIKNIYGL